MHPSLVRDFHEPVRLEIMSLLLGSPDGFSFTELKESLSLTDGNLNRHLKVLTDAGAIQTGKAPGKGRARTMIRLSDSGMEEFLGYLDSLEAVLEKTARRLEGDEVKRIGRDRFAAFARHQRA